MKHIFYVFFILCFIELNAQTDDNYLLSTNFGYYSNHLDKIDVNEFNEGYPNYGEKINNLTFTLRASRKFKTNFYYGLGLSYNISKQELNPESDVPQLSSSIGYFSSYSNLITTNNTISPIIFIQYYKNLTDKFCIAIDLYSKYDFNKNQVNGIFYMPNTIDHTYIKVAESETEIKTQYLNFGFCPSLRLDIFNNFGLEFTFGLIEYNQKLKDSRNDQIDKKTKEFEIGFAPKNWLIGLYLKM